MFSQAKEIKKGDAVKTSTTAESKVLCVLKTVMPRGKASLCKVGNLLLTPYHPVKLENSWKFPIDISGTVAYECDAVYTFLLDGAR